MRNRFAMAGGGSHDAITAAPWFAPILAFVSASMTAFVIWAGQRLVGKAAWQTAITAANKDLIDQLQEERRAIRDEFEAYKLESATDRGRLHGEIANLTQALQSLRSFLRREGIEIPEQYREPVEMTILKGNG